ncbi:Glycosyl transferase, group 2 family protein [gamma proteobacterium HdN1]|nr:Glycosyl transferase, group 2 family protein [gamma proteobacterium HdN1]
MKTPAATTSTATSTTAAPTQAGSPLLSVIIVNYNAGRLLSECVQSVQASLFVTNDSSVGKSSADKSPAAHTVECIVVDNASADQSLALLADLPLVEHRPPPVIIRNDANLGFAAACNVGIHAATGKYLLFLNPDSVVEPNTLQSLITSLESASDIGMVGGLLLNPDGSEQGGGRRAIPTPWRSFVRAFGLSRFAKRWPELFFDFHLHQQALPTQAVNVEAISGACMLVRREALAQVGLWDEQYFLHCEDLDWCMRFRQAGWQILFVPNALITHQQGSCSRSRPIFVEWHKHKGMLRFYRKFFQKEYPGALMWIVVVGVWMRFAAAASYHIGKRTLAKAKNSRKSQDLA